MRLLKSSPTVFLFSCIFASLVFAQDSSPLSIVIAFDSSRSMQESLSTRIKAVGDFAEKAILTLNAEVAFLQFDERIILVQDFTGNPSALRESIGKIWVGGPAKLYAAVTLITSNLLNERENQRVIVVLSDGNSNGRTSLDDALKQAKQHKVRIYAIGIKDPHHPSDLKTLDRLAKESGGVYIKSEVERLDKDLTKIFEAIGSH